jgi:hypothetical protein
MQKTSIAPQEAREEDKGLMKEDLEWERSDKEIRGDIVPSAMPAVVAVEPEKWEVMAAVLMVEMEEKEFSPTFPVWQLGTVAVGPAGLGTEPVARVDWVAEETAEVIP